MTKPQGATGASAVVPGNTWEMGELPMLRTVVVVGTLLLGVGVVAAQQDLIKQTQTVMKGNGKNAGALGAIVKGRSPTIRLPSMRHWPS